MKKRSGRDVTTGDISKHLIRLTLPTIGGFIAIAAFNLTDTFFVARLGTEALAAMGFTFPVVMVTGAMATGLSMGAGSVLARAIGAGDRRLMRHTATYGILLALVVVAIVSLGGLLSMDLLFRAMGAEGESLRLVKEYMFIWYLGCLAIVMPPVGDASLRATGDMVRPFIVMSVCAVVNVILDPLLIFGIGIFPEMGIRGASLATVIARLCGMCFTLFFNYKADLLELTRPVLKNILESWKRILHVGVPSVLTQLLPPLTRGVLTTLGAAAAGTAGVAALAAGNRIESIPMIISRAMNLALLTVIGQNWGSAKWDRVNEVRIVMIKLALRYALTVYVILWPAAPYIGKIFTVDPVVLQHTISYLRILFVGYFGMMLFSWTAIGLNAVGKPFWSFVLNLGGILVFMIPGAFIGRWVGGFNGMIGGLAAGQLLAGAAAYFIGKKQLWHVE
jgi:putative MATE family efflux protein